MYLLLLTLASNYGPYKVKEIFLLPFFLPFHILKTCSLPLCNAYKQLEGNSSLFYIKTYCNLDVEYFHYPKSVTFQTFPLKQYNPANIAWKPSY